MQVNKLQPLPHTIYKHLLEMGHRPKCNFQSYRTPWLRQIFLESHHTKHEPEKKGIDKLYFIKLKTSLQKTWLNEKTSHRQTILYDKGYVSRIYKGLFKLNNK